MAVSPRVNNPGHDLSSAAYTGAGDHSASEVHLVVSRWNDQVTFSLRDAAVETLIKAGVHPSHIYIHYVPGSFELPQGAAYAISQDPDAVICLGCVIQGETRHFDFICSSVANAIGQLNITQAIPVIFGVLTPNTMDQARARSGGKLGNKGTEAAVAALEMIDLRRKLLS